MAIFFRIGLAVTNVYAWEYGLSRVCVIKIRGRLVKQPNPGEAVSSGPTPKKTYLYSEIFEHGHKSRTSFIQYQYPGRP